jgi:thiol-disulfide isomerase/thioredoxin
MRKLVQAVLLSGCGLVALGDNPAVAQQPTVMTPRNGAGNASVGAGNYGAGNYGAGNYGAGNYGAGNYGAGNYSAGNYSAPSGTPADAAAPLVWLENVDVALQQAAAQQRLVLVHFWSDNCPPCVGVERNVLSRPDVQRAIQASFVPVKIKVDNQPRVAERFRVDRWPTDLILLPDGQELIRSVSSQDPARYVAFLNRSATVLNNAGNFAANARAAP